MTSGKSCARMYREQHIPPFGTGGKNGRLRVGTLALDPAILKVTSDKFKIKYSFIQQLFNEYV